MLLVFRLLRERFPNAIPRIKKEHGHYQLAQMFLCSHVGDIGPTVRQNNVSAKMRKKNQKGKDSLDGIRPVRRQVRGIVPRESKAPQADNNQYEKQNGHASLKFNPFSIS